MAHIETAICHLYHHTTTTPKSSVFFLVLFLCPTLVNLSKKS